MNNVFVYCEIEGTQVQEVSQELLTKGRKLANQLGVDLNAIVAVPFPIDSSRWARRASRPVHPLGCNR